MSTEVPSRELEFSIEIKDVSDVQKVFGKLDQNIKLIEDIFGVTVDLKDNTLSLWSKEPANAHLARDFIKELFSLVEEGTLFSPEDLRKMALSFKEDQKTWWKNTFGQSIMVTAYHKSIRPKTPGQVNYVRAVHQSEMVFCIGPAGTGKTYLAMAMACAALRNKEVSRIVLIRPAVEAGESLGYLPGDLKEKIEPYLRPLYDALYELLSPEKFHRYSEKGIIEVAPLAYMRGRTLNDSFIVLDEAQNTTPEQMKMFLTRMGFGSKVVVTGDITQIDLPAGHNSGLVLIQQILRDIPGIEFVYLSEKDVIRHQLVQKIILAYEKFEKEKLNR
ncbi:MAG: phosphate starvation-inducible protein PhoH [Candidatus Atribacteria bacterium]|nr:phosphate starvation-inducible protein PhoH [Candidatus Atribacteria bacterium]